MLHGFWLSPLCVFKCALKLPIWVAFVWIFKCALKHLSGRMLCHSICIYANFLYFLFFSNGSTTFIHIWEDALSHWLRLFGFYLLCMFKWLPKLPGCREAKLHEQNQRGENHIRTSVAKDSFQKWFEKAFASPLWGGSTSESFFGSKYFFMSLMN